jgi:hypothetical protein
VFVVDTDVFIYAAESSFAEHVRCRELVERWRLQPGAWFTTWSILYEFLRVVTHPRVFRNPWPVADAWHFVEGILAAPALAVLVATERHAAVAARVLAEVPHVAGNLLHDAHTAILMREHGIRTIYTRDTDFHRFPSIDVRDPVTEGNS